MRVSDIACHLHVSASNVTQMVTELEDKGLVERKMDELVLHPGEERSKTLIGLLGEAEGFLMQGNKGYKDQRNA